MSERTWLDRLLRREDVTVNPIDEGELVKHRETLEAVESSLTASRQKVANAINETGQAIERRRAERRQQQQHRYP